MKFSRKQTSFDAEIIKISSMLLFMLLYCLHHRKSRSDLKDLVFEAFSLQWSFCRSFADRILSFSLYSQSDLFSCSLVYLFSLIIASSLLSCDDCWCCRCWLAVELTECRKDLLLLRCWLTVELTECRKNLLFLSYWHAVDLTWWRRKKLVLSYWHAVDLTWWRRHHDILTNRHLSRLLRACKIYDLCILKFRRLTPCRVFERSLTLRDVISLCRLRFRLRFIECLWWSFFELDLSWRLNLK